MTMPGKMLETARRMTEAEVETAALGDPDAQPLSEADLARMKRTPQARIIRRAQGLPKNNSLSVFPSRLAPCAIGSRAAPNQTRPQGPV